MTRAALFCDSNLQLVFLVNVFFPILQHHSKCSVVERIFSVLTRSCRIGRLFRLGLFTFDHLLLFPQDQFTRHQNMSSQTLVARADAPFDLYPYVPSASAGYAFTAVFGIAVILHCFLTVKLRAWFFIPLFLGCIGKPTTDLSTASS
jgi:hypothetical protein